jgi:hypothetical protein
LLFDGDERSRNASSRGGPRTKIACARSREHRRRLARFHVARLAIGCAGPRSDQGIARAAPRRTEERQQSPKNLRLRCAGEPEARLRHAQRRDHLRPAGFQRLRLRIVRILRPAHPDIGELDPVQRLAGLQKARQVIPVLVRHHQQVDLAAGDRGDVLHHGIHFSAAFLVASRTPQSIMIWASRAPPLRGSDTRKQSPRPCRYIRTTARCAGAGFALRLPARFFPEVRRTAGPVFPSLT